MSRQVNVVPMIGNGTPASAANNRKMQDAVNPEIDGAMNPIPGNNVPANGTGASGINLFEHPRHETPAQLKAMFSKRAKK